MSAASSKLFQPLKVGSANLKHRVVMAPLTRYRSSAEHVHGNVPAEYYKQRSVVPGTLLITEATFIAPEAGGYANVPGIWSEEQVEGWKKATKAVHDNGSFIFLQLWALGRAANPEILKSEGGYPFVSASNIPIKSSAAQGTPRPLSIDDIKRYQTLYATAAKNAIRAGFDGVEIHGANGYLIDQFIQDVSNNRTDKYGGSIENRARFALEVTKSVVDAIGASKTGIRLSPFGTFQDMHMKDPVPQYTYLVEKLAENHPELAYLHIVEPDPTHNGGFVGDSSDFIRKIWAPKPYLAANGYSPESAIKDADANENVAIVFGKWFISNPDLPNRIKNNEPLTPFNVQTFYVPGPDKTEGYTDYPLTAEGLAQVKVQA